MNGKGSKRRPHFVPLHEIGANWARVFEKQKQAEKEQANDNSRSAKSNEGTEGTEEGQRPK